MVEIIWIEIEEILNEWESVDFDTDTPDWPSLLEYKRNDTWYDSVYESIRRNGFKCPLAFYAYTTPDGTLRKHQDGHHRLTAAHDLGYKWVPYVKVNSWNDTPELSDLRWQRFNYQHPANPAPEGTRELALV